MSEEQLRANDLTKMKMASSWLTSIPRREGNTYAVALRYQWRLKYLPSVYSCGKPFNVNHAMYCLKGGYIHQRHDEMRGLIATIATEILQTLQQSLNYKN